MIPEAILWTLDKKCYSALTELGLLGMEVDSELHAELQKILGKSGKAKLNNSPFLAGILQSVMIQTHQLCPDLSDSKETNNMQKFKH